jgi:hypothetical protein
MTNGKRQIKIYQKTYQLPVLSGGTLDQLQKQIRKRNEHLSQGKLVVKKVEQRVFFGKKIVEERVRNPLSFEERYQELNAIVQDYDSMVAMLKHHEYDYQYFFRELAQEIREIITNNCLVISEKEQKREAKERLERQKSDPNSQSLALLASMKGQLLEITKSTGYAAVLMLKKLDVMSKSLERIANDQETQRQFLASVLDEIRSQKDLYELQLEINALQADTAKLVDIALNFDEYMKPFMGNFQVLLNNVAQVDQELSRAMGEINNIARLLEAQQFGNLERDQDSQRIADFLITGELKKDRLQEALDQMDNVATGAAFDAELLGTGQNISLEDCLANIREFMGLKLDNLKVIAEVKEGHTSKDEQTSNSVAIPITISPQLQEIIDHFNQQRHDLFEDFPSQPLTLTQEAINRKPSPSGSRILQLEISADPSQADYLKFEMDNASWLIPNITSKSIRVMMRVLLNEPYIFTIYGDPGSFIQLIKPAKLKAISNELWEIEEPGEFALGSDVNLGW